jgi:hypothetical protein
MHRQRKNSLSLRASTGPRKSISSLKNDGRTRSQWIRQLTLRQEAKTTGSLAHLQHTSGVRSDQIRTPASSDRRSSLLPKSSTHRRLRFSSSLTHLCQEGIRGIYEAVA